MHLRKDLPILIVGAGPTGLTAALELARRGVEVRIVEKRTEPSSLSRAVGLMPGSMEIFQACGAEQKIRSEALEIEALDIWHRDRKVTTINMDGHEDPAVRLLCLPQDRTELHLAEALQTHGITVEYGEVFESLKQDSEKVSATVSGESRLYAGVLGCDGAISMVREEIGLVAEGYDLEEDWSIADLEIPAWTDRRFRVSVMDKGELCIIVPMADGRYRLVTTEPDSLEANPIPIPEYRVRRAGSFRISVRQVPEYNVGRVWLAGDAAHTHSPVGGRGMNLGIADASEWARRYSEGTLEGYSAARHTIGAETIEFTETARKMLQEGSELKRDLLLFGVRGLGLMKFVHPRIVQQMVMGELI